MGTGLYHRIFQVQETENLRQIGLSNKESVFLRELESIQAGQALMYSILRSLAHFLAILSARPSSISYFVPGWLFSEQQKWLQDIRRQELRLTTF